MTSFDEKFQRLVGIRRGDAASESAGSAAEQAQRYLLTEMLPDLVDFTTRNSDPLGHDVDLLISLVGFSPITTILTYSVLKPRQVLAITSSSAADSFADRPG